jgi:hypothetical protein
MKHRCKHCDCPLRTIIAHTLWSVHKVCVRCGTVFVCFDDAVFYCETPETCAPFPRQLLRPPENFNAIIMPGPNCRGLI